VLTFNIPGKKISKKRRVQPLRKTAENVYENNVLTGIFLGAGKLLANVMLSLC